MSDSVQDALFWAAKRHRGQWRDGLHPLPYLVHVVDVVSNLRHIGGVTDSPVLAAAVLHDVVEETSATHEDVERKFGTRIAALVRELTRSEPTDTARKGLSELEVWQLRSHMLIRDIAAMGREAQAVKLADRLSNLREAELTRTGERLDRYRLQTQSILDAIPESVNPALWRAVEDLLPASSR